MASAGRYWWYWLDDIGVQTILMILAGRYWCWLDDIDVQTILTTFAGLGTYVYIIRQRHTPQPSVHKVGLCAGCLGGGHSGQGHQLFSPHSRAWAAQFLASVALAAKNPPFAHSNRVRACVASPQRGLGCQCQWVLGGHTYQRLNLARPPSTLISMHCLGRHPPFGSVAQGHPWWGQWHQRNNHVGGRALGARASQWISVTTNSWIIRL